MTGDIVHGKTDTTPELFDLVREFFQGLADICPTYIMVGNHDLNLSNPERMDALTPIIRALNHPNLHYLLYSEVVEIDNVCLHHLSRLGSQEDWEEVKLVNDSDGKVHVGLYHGIVKGAKTNTGFDGFKSYIALDQFENFDITLLGDIHKRQFLDKDQRIAYAGSLIQQDFGEEIEKGYLIWDLDSLSAEFIQIENDYAYLTVKFDGDTPSILVDQMPANVRLRLQGLDIDRDIVNEYVSEIKSKSLLSEFRNEIKESATATEIEVDVEAVTKTADPKIQMKLIREFLSDHDITDDVWDKIKNINDDLNTKLNRSGVNTRSVKWKPIKFEFSNMFAFGEDNVLHFNEYNGVIGLFAPNASGKSSILDSLLFCLFDKCSKTNTAADILNSSSDKFYCKLDFKIGEELYSIERIGTKNSNGSVSVKVEFKKHTDDGEQSLTGKRRSETNKIIQEYLGDYDDFVLTTLSAQKDNRTFIDMTKKERQELLYRFMDIYIFIDLFDLAKKESADTQAEIRVLDKEDFTTQKREIKDQMKVEKSTLKERNESMDVTNKKLQNVEERIENLVEKLRPVETVDKTDVQIDSEIQTIKSNIKTIQEQHKGNLDKLNEATGQLRTYLDQLQKIDNIEELSEELNKLNDLQQKLSDTKHKLSSVDRDIANAEKKIHALENHEYDPNCKYCVDNPFVKDARKAQTEIKDLYTTKEEYKQVLQLSEKVSKDILDLSTRIQKYDNLKRSQEQSAYLIENIKANISANESKIETYQERIKFLESEKQRYLKSKDDIKFNEEVNAKIHELKQERQNYRDWIKLQQSKINESTSKIQTFKSRLEEVVKRETYYRELINKNEAYDLYMRATYRDGIPYMILKKILPIISEEVNTSMLGIVDFTFELIVDEKDNIEGFITDQRGRRPMEMASGMETFVLSTAIRSSLVKLSDLPKPNFMAIDEGFGVLDADKLNNMGLLFSFLKKTFDFVLCITHVTAVKDYVDAVISINQKDGKSEITA